MDEKVEGPQEQVPEHVPIPPKKLREILEAHRKWVDSEAKEGERADLRGANLQRADLWKANLQGADLRGANLQEAFLRETNPQKANLRGANLQWADLWKANLQRADLWKANLQRANLRGAVGLTASQIKNAKNWELAFYSHDFLGKLGLPPDHNERVKKKLAEMEKEKKVPEHVPIPPKKLREILEAHRKWVDSEAKEGERADLLGANLQAAHLFGANLQGADLRGANLQEAFLREANLQKANLRGANLQQADFRGGKGLTAIQVKAAKKWELAFYSKDFLKELGLPPDHNKTLPDKLAELEKKKKAAGAK